MILGALRRQCSQPGVAKSANIGPQCPSVGHTVAEKRLQQISRLEATFAAHENISTYIRSCCTTCSWTISYHISQMIYGYLHLSFIIKSSFNFYFLIFADKFTPEHCTNKKCCYKWALY